MSATLRNTILALTTLADSLWLYPVLGVFGLATNQGGAAIPWIAAFAVLAVGVVSTRRAAAAHGATPQAFMILAVIGIAAVYLTIAATLNGVDAPWDIGWFARMAVGDVSGPDVIRILVILLSVAFLWRRAVRIANEPTPDDRLRRCFRSGTLGLALVLIVELATGIDLAAATMLIPFFTATLCGLALIHRPVDPVMARNWIKIASATIFVIVGLGFLFGTLGGALGGNVVGVLGVVWVHFLAAAAWILDLLLAPLLELFFSFIESLKPEGGSLPSPVQRPDVDWDRIDVGKAAPFVDAVVSFLRFPLIALFLYLLISYLMRSHRRWNTTARNSPVTVARETVARENDALADLARMIENLLPEWMTRRGGKAPWQYPQGMTGITEIYELYFGMLDTAMERGVVLSSGATPRERISDLEAALPGFPVKPLTEKFNAACFGDLASSAREIDTLRQAIDCADGDASDPATKS